MSISIKRLAIAGWVLLIAGFAALHFVHLSADFPNHSQWYGDWAKYTDEGWYGNAAVRAHLFGNWYLPGDFNPAPAVPVWPFLEWVLFSFTGVSLVAARTLAVGIFCVNLVLSYTLLRVRAERWTALLAVTLVVTSPFFYAFSRLAILEPLLLTCYLSALNLAVRLPRWKWKIAVSSVIGLLFTLMLLTKTTSVFLLPALVWAMVATLREEELPWWKPSRAAIRSVLAAGAASAISFAAWIAVVISRGLWDDFQYLFTANNWHKPPHWYWPLKSLWRSSWNILSPDKILIGLTLLLLYMVLRVLASRRAEWTKKLLLDPVFGTSVLGIAGFILFMTYQNNPQYRYYVVVALFAFFLLVLAVEARVKAESAAGAPLEGAKGVTAAVFAVLLGTLAFNSFQTLYWATHPEYTWVNAAQKLTRYIDGHPNGKRLLLSVSSDQITLMTHLPAICDDFGNLPLADRIAAYKPGWYAAWNDLDAGTLEDLHTHYSLEQVASWPALDDPDRNVLVLFKLHPLPRGQVREPKNDQDKSLRVKLPGDKFDVDVDDSDAEE